MSIYNIPFVVSVYLETLEPPTYTDYVIECTFQKKSDMFFCQKFLHNYTCITRTI